MSDHIPFEIQMDIMKRLPMKSLVRCSSVSKPWKSLIESTEFINNYHVSNTRHHLLVRYYDQEHSMQKYVSLVDDDNFPKQTFDRNPPLNINLHRDALILGSSHGLLCLYGLYGRPDYEKDMVVLWNPSIRKSVRIVVPKLLRDVLGNTIIGFGVCPKTCDPKLVKITRIHSPSKLDTCEVFTLSLRAWRSIFINLPHKSIVFHQYRPQVVIKGVIYWTAHDMNTIDDRSYNLIISFDLTSEEFGEVYLPNRLRYEKHLLISKLYDSLVVLEHYQEDLKQVCGVWIVKDGVSKLFTVRSPKSVILDDVIGFMKNGKPITETWNTRHVPGMLQVYDPCSEHFNDLGIRGKNGLFSVSSYAETLLLLDHPSSTIYC